MNGKVLVVCLFALTFVFTSLPGEVNAIPFLTNNNTDLSLFTFTGGGFGVTGGFPGQGNGVSGGFPGQGNGVTGGFPGQGNGVSSTHAPEPASLALLLSGLVGLVGIKRVKRRSQ